MPKLYYDWINIKREYLASEYDNVRDFIRAHYPQITSCNTIGRNTKGWRKLKEESKTSITRAAVQKLEESGEIQRLQEMMIKGKNIILHKLLQAFAAKDEPLDRRETNYAIAALDAIKRELGEPLVISKNDTTVTNLEPVQIIFDLSNAEEAPRA